uniref:Putative secreted protein n=1 Tax=Ixodes ricinus TaxID=34613 RepID=A0A6B0U293_IXORI
MAACCPGLCPWASATLASSTRTGPETAAKNTGASRSPAIHRSSTRLCTTFGCATPSPSLWRRTTESSCRTTATCTSRPWRR